MLTPNNKVYQVIMNKPALLDCAYFGSPIPDVTWYVWVYMLCVFAHPFCVSVCSRLCVCSLTDLPRYSGQGAHQSAREKPSFIT